MYNDVFILFIAFAAVAKGDALHNIKFMQDLSEYSGIYNYKLSEDISCY
jgi:hypothetical protein